MIVSNAANLKVGDEYRTPGQPVPEFKEWPHHIQTLHLRIRRVVDVSDDVAKEMREEHAGKEEKANRERKERKLKAAQQEVLTLSRQIETERHSTSNKIELLDKAETELLRIAEELKIDPDNLELGTRPQPKGQPTAPKIPLEERPNPQRLADHMADMSGHDIAKFADEDFGLPLSYDRSRDDLILALFQHIYGDNIAVPEPSEEAARLFGVSQSDLVRMRREIRDDLQNRSTKELKDLAKEHGAKAKGSKAELIESVAMAIEKEQLNGVGSGDTETD